MNSSVDLDFAVALAKEAGDILMSYYGQALTKKIKNGPSDYSTQADIAAEKFILEQIKKQYPADAIVAEESGKHDKANSEYTWIVDPLDGTHNFAENLQSFGVLLARAKGEKVVLAVAYDPVRLVTATAAVDHGTFINRNRINLSTVRQANLPISANSEIHQKLESLGTSDTNRSAIGSALDTLAGKCQAYVSKAGFIWDFAAPALLLSEAGWQVTNFAGQQFRWDGRVVHGHPGVIAAPAAFHAKSLSLWHHELMQKRAIIIHGWSGYPTEAWFPWLKQELEQRDFIVQVPAMPQPDEPQIETWVPRLKEIIGKPDENTYLIGHSMGCQTILRYLAGLDDEKVGGIVLVAGFFDLRLLKTDEEKRILKPWLATPLNLEKIRQATDNITAIFSDNDPWVPMASNIVLFKQKLGDNITIVVEHNKEHFSESSGLLELPSALDSILDYER